jgi:hypothetical protein
MILSHVQSAFVCITHRYVLNVGTAVLDYEYT